MATSFDIAGAQINGARDYQEDAFLVTRLSGERDGALVIVADGMGGHAAGNVASNLAVQTFNTQVSAHIGDGRPAETLREAVEAANASIRDTVQETPALQGMGCTFVGVLLRGQELRWVSVGDSHLYLLRGDSLVKQNADHSYGGFLDRMAAAGTPAEAEAGFSRNMLMSALTGSEISEIDCPQSPVALRPGDRLIIASDGLDTLQSGELIRLSLQADSAQACVEALLGQVTAANQPRQDNTTVVVVDLPAPPARAAPGRPAAEPGGLRLDEAPPTRAAPRPRDRENPSGPARAGRPAGTGSPVLRRAPARRRTAPVALAVLAVALLAGGALWLSGTLPWQQAAGPTLPPSAWQPAVPAGAPPAVEENAVSEAQVTGSEAAVTFQVELFADRLRDGSRGPEMVKLPGGTFEMGSSSLAPDFDERPRHAVTLVPFAMATRELSVEHYRRFARATGRPLPSAYGQDPASWPVTGLSWADARDYARWLSAQTGERYRLPSEAEWEYAARAGSLSAYWWGERPSPGTAWCFGCEPGAAPRAPRPSGTLAANPFGLYDVAGNVLEWVEDCYHPSYDGAPADGSAWVEADCARRVARGGSYMSAPGSVRSARREAVAPTERADHLGLRLVREL